MNLIATFAEKFGAESTFIVRSPGRVNLIGEHVDYNDGFVLPMAVSLQTDMVLRERNDNKVVLCSPLFDEQREFDVNNPIKQEAWIDYAQAVAYVLKNEGIVLRGFEGVVTSNVPLASGLSSSASFEVGVALALLHVAQVQKSAAEVALLCQKAENQFIGVNCGIMDQMAVAACAKGHALLLDCRSLETKQVPFVLKDHAVVVTDSAAPRELASSAYNQRRIECETGLSVLQKYLPNAKSLRDVTPTDFAKFSHELDPIVRKRVSHIVGEIARTGEAVSALQNGDLETFGRKMNESHFALRDEYEVSSRELDFLTDFARNFEGVLGSRMTGAGFGGCTVTLVQKDRAQELINAQIKAYKEATGREAQAWVCDAEAGAEVLTSS
jgi:galactokinase